MRLERTPSLGRKSLHRFTKQRGSLQLPPPVSWRARRCRRHVGHRPSAWRCWRRRRRVSSVLRLRRRRVDTEWACVVVVVHCLSPEAGVGRGAAVHFEYIIYVVINKVPKTSMKRSSRAGAHYLTAQSAGPHHAAASHSASSSSSSFSPSAASAAPSSGAAATPSSGAAATPPSGTAGYALATYLVI